MKKMIKSTSVVMLLLITIILQGLFYGPVSAENTSGDIEKGVKEIERQILDYKFGTALENAQKLADKVMSDKNMSATERAEANHVLGLCFYQMYDVTAADSVLESAINEVRTVTPEKDSLLAEILITRGQIWINKINYNKARGFITEARQVLAKSDKSFPIIEARAEYYLGIILDYDHNFQAAADTVSKALEIQKRILGEDHRDVARSYSGLGTIYEDIGSYKQAEENHRKSLAIRESLYGKDHPQVCLALLDLASLYYTTGEYSKIMPLVDRASRILKPVLPPDQFLWSQIASIKGNLYQAQGKVDSALAVYEKARDIIVKTYGPDHVRAGDAYNNLAIINTDMGNYEKALEFHHKALEIAETNLDEFAPAIGTSLMNIAYIYKMQKKFKEALPLDQRVVEIYEKVYGPEHPNTALALNNLAATYTDLGRYEEAEEMHRQALKVREAAFDERHPEVAMSLMNLGNVLTLQGKFDEAIPNYEKALSIWEEKLGRLHPLTSYCIRALAQVSAVNGDWLDCLDYFRRLVKVRQEFMNYAFAISSEDQKLRWTQLYPPLDPGILQLAQIWDTSAVAELALDMVLKGKVIVLDAAMAKRKVTFCAADTSLIRLQDDNAHTCGEIAHMILTSVGKNPDPAYLDSLNKLFDYQDSLETLLSKECAEFNSELISRSFSIDDIVKALPDKAVLWEFVKYYPQSMGAEVPPEYICFTLDKTGKISVANLGPVSTVDSLIDLVRGEIQDAATVVYSDRAVASRDRLNEYTSHLYDLLVAPLLAFTPEAGEIFVSPDGNLSLLPFEIIHTPEDHYLIEDLAVSYVSSGRDLVRFRRQESLSGTAMIMADPDFDLTGPSNASKEKGVLSSLLLSDDVTLPFTALRGIADCLSQPFTPLRYGRQELDSIAKTIRAESEMTTKTFSGRDFSETLIKNLDEAPEVLHLSTHGFFCEDGSNQSSHQAANPLLFSGLALAGANRIFEDSLEENPEGEDGILTAFEVSSLNLFGTELAVLSACETGVGKTTHGEGVFGLQRAFRHAGVQTIIMSLWKIPDKETARLMTYFYDNWLGGLSKKQALRKATLDLLKQCRTEYGHDHPLMWGGFVLAGNAY